MPALVNSGSQIDAPLAKSKARTVVRELTDETQRKTHGIHYTPPLLADYLARQVALEIQSLPRTRRQFAVLDPACGDGGLLKAVADAVPPAFRERLSLVGFDTDERALAKAETALKRCGLAALQLEHTDFLSVISSEQAEAQMGLHFVARTKESHGWAGRFQAVISNPPYVRTQVLGSAAAQELATRFGLTGRVDLYHAFVKAMTLALDDQGILALLTSNRFLSVQSGSSMREWMTEHFQLLRLVDLGDTKLFDAAVLPAVLVAKRSVDKSERECEFIRVYETPERAGANVRDVGSILEVADGSFAGFARTDGVCFQVETGRLQTGADGRTPWTMSNGGVDSWLATVKANSAGTFANVAKICVGIKTTADSVFIRDDWDSLPEDERPENELLRPLVTHHRATCWHVPATTLAIKRVLYPYEVTSEDRTPVDLADYPRARAYLLKHRERLQSRNYVIESGRQWYEIWVPHRPKDWTRPKLAFPDISETSKFFFVEEGWIVNGDCYWTKLLPGKDVSWLSLMLAVANSSFALKFYDTVFHNKLYSGRRRFMSQYVSRFPLPKLDRAKDIIAIMPRVLKASSEQNTDELERLQDQLDGLVWKAFGLPKEIAR